MEKIKITNGVIHLTVNGVHFTVVTPAAIKKFDLKKEALTSLGNRRYLYAPRLTRRNLYWGAGYRDKSFDWAVPQPWIDNNPDVKKRWKSGDRAVWLYEGNNFGKPLWDSDVRRKLKVIINKRLKSRK